MADTLAITLTTTITEGTTSQTDKRIFTATDSGITEDTNQKINIASGATDHLLDFGEASPLEHFVIGFSGPVTVKLNDSGDSGIVLTGTPFLCLSGANVTAIYVTNASGSTVVATLIGGYSA